MPAKRIPWFKMWVGSTRHEKVAQLDDRAFRTWVELLDGASQQTVRGRFASVQAAAAVVRRPVSSIRRLVNVGLLDEATDGAVWMHDWQDWQRWRPEDGVNDYGTTTESLAINTPLPTDRHTNINGLTHDHPSRGAERAKKEKGEEEEDVSTPPSPQRGKRAKPAHEVLTEHERTALLDKWAAPYGGREAAWNEVVAALNHEARLKCQSERLYVDRWLRRELEHRPALRLANGRTEPPRHVVDRTGVEN